jgi:hypothetical protein
MLFWLIKKGFSVDKQLINIKVKLTEKILAVLISKLESRC